MSVLTVFGIFDQGFDESRQTADVILVHMGDETAFRFCIFKPFLIIRALTGAPASIKYRSSPISKRVDELNRQYVGSP